MRDHPEEQTRFSERRTGKSVQSNRLTLARSYVLSIGPVTFANGNQRDRKRNQHDSSYHPK